MKDLGKFILVQMYDRSMNDHIQGSRVSPSELLFQIQNVYHNLTNFNRSVSEEDFNAALNDLLHHKSVRQLKRGGRIYYQLTEKGGEQAETLMAQLRSHKYLQREPASKPLADYRSLEPGSYKSAFVLIGIVAFLALITWMLLWK